VIHTILHLVEHYIQVLIADFFKIAVGITLYFLFKFLFPDYQWLLSLVSYFCDFIYALNLAWELTKVDWEKEFFWEGHPQGFWHAIIQNPVRF